jgi:hypothetical protein
VDVDIDESGRQYQVWKIQKVACWNFHIAARPQSSDLPIFYNHYRRFNPFDRSNQARGGNDCGHQEISAQSCLHVLCDCCNHKTPRKAPGSPLKIEMVAGKHLVLF